MHAREYARALCKYICNFEKLILALEFFLSKHILLENHKKARL